MTLFTFRQSYTPAAPPSKDRTIRSRAPSPPTVGFRVPHGLPTSHSLPIPSAPPVFVPEGGRGRSQQYIGRQPPERTNKDIEIVDLTTPWGFTTPSGFRFPRAPPPSAPGSGVPHGVPPVPDYRAPPSSVAGSSVTHGLPHVVPEGGGGQYSRRQPPEYTGKDIQNMDLTGDDRKRLVSKRQAAGGCLTSARTNEHSTVAKESGPTSAGTRAAKDGTAGDGDYCDDSDDSDGDLPPIKVLIADPRRHRATAKACDKLRTAAGQPSGSVGGQIGNPNGDGAVATTAVAAGDGSDIPTMVNSDNEAGRILTAPPRAGSLDAHSFPPSETRVQHHGQTTGDARPGSVSTAPAQAREWIAKGGNVSNSSRVPAHSQSFSPRPEAACKDSRGPEVRGSSPPSDSVILSGTEDGLRTQFPPRSPTEEASDCIYQDGDNGCREPDHGAVKAPLRDAVRHRQSSASQVPERREDPNASDTVRPSASPTSEPAAGGPDYVRRLPKEQQCQYAPLRPDARLQYVTEDGQYSQQEDMLLDLSQEGKTQESKKRRRKRRSPSPNLGTSPSRTAVEDGPSSKRHRTSKSASQLPNTDQNARIAQAPQGQESNVPIILGGKQVKPGGYVIVTCENGGSSDAGRDDLPDIARVDKIRPDGRLNVTWTYHPSHPSVPQGSEHGRFELLISDHKDTVWPEVLTDIVQVEEFCENCLEAEHWCWSYQFQTRRRRIRAAPKPRRREEEK